MSGDLPVDAHLQRGILLLDMGRFGEATDYFRSAIEASLEDSRAYYYLAVCYYRAGRLFWAFRFLHRAQELAPDVPDYLVLDAWLSSSFPFALRRALATLDRALQLQPRLVSAFIAQAHIFRLQGRWKKCEAAAREALAIDPDNLAAVNFLALALRQRGGHEESRRLVLALMARLPNDSFTRANAGWSALQMGNYPQAQEHFITALLQDPHQSLALAGLPYVMYQRAWTCRLLLWLKLLFSRRRWWTQVAMLILLLPLVLIVIPVALAVACFSQSDAASETALVLFSTFIFVLCSGGVARLYIMSQPPLRQALHVGDAFSIVSSITALGILAVLLVSYGEWIPVGFIAFLMLWLALSIGNPGAFPKARASG